MALHWSGGDNVKFMGNCAGLSIPPGSLVYCWHPEAHVKCDLSKTDLKWNENVNLAPPPPHRTIVLLLKKKSS